LACLYAGGLHGLATLLERDGLPEPAAAAVAWAIYEVAKQAEKPSWAVRPPPEVVMLLRMLTALLQRPAQAKCIQWACCAAIDAFMKKGPCIGKIFVDLGGAPALVDTLLGAIGMGGDAQELSRACVYAITTLADGSVAQGQALRDAGAIEALARLSLKGNGGQDEQAAVWALGQLGGLAAVVEAMSQAPCSTAVLRSGVEAIAELAQHAAVPDDVARLPAVLHSLVTLLNRTDRLVPLPECVVAVNSVICGLAPHAAPGRLQELDTAVMTLLQILREEPIEDVRAAEEAAIGLGRLAMLSSSWHKILNHCGAAAVLVAHVENGSEVHMLSRCIRSASALLGVPYVVNELRTHLHNSIELVVASLCALADVLGDDLADCDTLVATKSSTDATLQGMLILIAQAMKTHSSDVEVQQHGCHCIGLLATRVAEAMPREAIDAIFDAAHRHSRCGLIARHACAALRELTVAGVRGSGAEGAAMASDGEQGGGVICILQREGAAAIVERVMGEFSCAGDVEMLEDAAAVLVALSGVASLLKVLTDARPGQLRAAGLKALFEFGRWQPVVLRRSADEATAAATSMLADSPDDQALQQIAELLLGLCGASIEGSSAVLCAAAARSGVHMQGTNCPATVGGG